MPASEPIVREPLCDLAYCPCPRSPDDHACWVCGSLSVQHDHVYGRGKERTWKREDVAILCAPHHEMVTLNQASRHIKSMPGRGRVFFFLDLRGNTIAEHLHPMQDACPAAESATRTERAAALGLGSAAEQGAGAEETLALGPPKSVPASPLSEDWAGLSDDDLQAKYDAAEQMQGLAYLLRCRAVWQYRENHVQTWGKSWTDQAIERFGCSRPYAFAYANLWGIYLMLDTNLQEGMASLTDCRSLMQHIGRRESEDAVKLLEAAVAHVAQYGQPPALSGLLGGAEAQPEREKHDCPLCGYSHWVIMEAEWKA